jgi:uncharacterized protein
MKGNEKLGVKVFLFLVAFSIINYYVISKLFIFFGYPLNGTFYEIWILASISYLVGAALIREFNNWLVKALSILFSAWLGMSFLFMLGFALYDLLNFIVPIDFFWGGAVIITVVVVTSIYSIYNITSFSIRTIRVESARLHKHFRIVQISDLHIGSTHNKNFLPRTVERVNELNPDFIAFTGDLIDGFHKYKKNEFDSLKGLNAPTFFVLGNHEQFLEMDEVYELLAKTDLKIMRDRFLIYDGIQIIGIDDTECKEEFVRKLNKIAVDHNRFSLLLYHRPNGFKAAADAGIDLMLSGHTHGGQIFPLNILLSIIDGPVRGLHKLKETYLYVSTGAGWWGAPMRLGSRNEIVVLDLIPKKIEEELEETENLELERKKELVNESAGVKISFEDIPIKETRRSKLKKAIFVNKSVDNAEIVSLRRGKTALKQSKHEHILFSVDRLVEDDKIKARLKKKHGKKAHIDMRRKNKLVKKKKNEKVIKKITKIVANKIPTQASSKKSKHSKKVNRKAKSRNFKKKKSEK